MVGPDSHHGRCGQRYPLGRLRRPRRLHVDLPGGVRGDPGQGPVLTRWYAGLWPATTGSRPRPMIKVDKDTHRPPGLPRPVAARHRVDPSPAGLRCNLALGAHVRHPAELLCARNSGSPAPPTWPGPTASSRRSSCHNTTPDSRPRPRTRAPASSPSPARSSTSCASALNAPSQTTTRCATSAWHFRSPPAATGAITSRPGSALHDYLDGTMAVFHGPRCLARYHADGQPIDSPTREAS